MRYSTKMGLAVCILAALCGSVPAQKGTCGGRPPNAIVIMVDDLGYHDLSIQVNLFGKQGSNDVRTPNIDRLMNQGVIFTSGYSVAGFCSPARAGFLSGIHPYHSGHQKNPARDDKDTTSGLPLHLETIPETLKKKGYKSAMIGKWHLGVTAGFHPLNRGFDYFMGFLGSGFDYFEWKRKFKSSFEYIFEQYRLFKKVKYLTDDFTQKTVKFLRKYKNEPMFIFLAYNAVHAPYDYRERDVDPWVSEDRVPHVAMIKAVDRGVGKIVGKLKEFGLDKCTMIIFTNDNGGHENGAINLPLDGFKGKLEEGGIRVPLSITYPGVIKAGQVTDKLANLLDIYPTLQALAGVPKNKRNKALEGVNLLPHVVRKGQSQPKKKGNTRAYLINRKPGKAIVRSGYFKLWLDTRKENADNPKYPKPFALYNLYKDIGESTNLIGSKKKKVEAMRAAYIKWDKKTIDPLFPGKFRIKPLTMWYGETPKSPLDVNVAYVFRAAYGHEYNAPLDKVRWEIFKPKAIFLADYKKLRIRNDIHKIQWPKRLKTEILFKRKGTWIVRCNIQVGEWVDWEDVKLTIK